MYNLDICTTLLEVAMSKGQAHELGESILSLFTANRVEHQIIMFCLQKELDENSKYFYCDIFGELCFCDFY